MKQITRLFLLIIALSFYICSGYSQVKQRVHVIEISGEVDLGMASYVEHSAIEAEKDNAIILLHVNTFGGRVDAATRIRDAIFNAKVPLTIAFVDKRAISAGSLITLSAKKIAMASGASMGATTPDWNPDTGVITCKNGRGVGSVSIVHN